MYQTYNEHFKCVVLKCAECVHDIHSLSVRVTQSEPGLHPVPAQWLRIPLSRLFALSTDRSNRCIVVQSLCPQQVSLHSSRVCLTIRCVCALLYYFRFPLQLNQTWNKPGIHVTVLITCCVYSGLNAYQLYSFYIRTGEKFIQGVSSRVLSCAL